MAIHKRLDMYTRVTKFRCDSCTKYIEEDERNFFSRSTREPTETLCSVCYARAKTFQVVAGFFALAVVSMLSFALFYTIL